MQNAAQSFFQIRDIAHFSSDFKTWVVSERRTISCMNERRYQLKKHTPYLSNVEEIGGGSLQSPEKDYVGQIKSFG